MHTIKDSKMENLAEVIYYIFCNYPNPFELSKARVVKMVYLADWKSAIDQGKQITAVEWYYNHYGPYVKEIIEEIKNDNRFEIRETSNSFGEYKELIILKYKTSKNFKLDESTIKILDFVINATSKLYWNDFIDLIYSTYPIVIMPKFSTLDLVKLAKEYNKVKF